MTSRKGLKYFKYDMIVKIAKYNSNNLPPNLILFQKHRANMKCVQDKIAESLPHDTCCACQMKKL